MKMNAIVMFLVYFLVFALIHSLLATDYIKNKARMLPGKGFRFYRIGYTIISFLTFAPAFLTWMKYTASMPLVYSISPWLYPVVILIRIFALGMFVYAVLQTDVMDFIGIRQQTKNILITNGAYGIVRHPLYASGMLLLFTKMEMSRLDLVASALVSIYLIIGAYIEERRLLSVFGEEYRKYQQQVSMFIPMKWISR
ncbi:MAG: isoprenylcysteine carboxylmethyltransferase family protein [Candidatus Methanoperedens sp.]|nr:isoprenylcysteine carboxylmethyltransferase family protein [Candidatus Methanoperedens sp.]